MPVRLTIVRIFWVVALLLTAGGQFIHAWEDLDSCSMIHESEHQTPISDDSGCPADHACCLNHPLLIGTLPEALAFVPLALTPDFSFDRGNFVVEGPVRKIDHPPQLS